MLGPRKHTRGGGLFNHKRPWNSFNPSNEVWGIKKNIYMSTKGQESDDFCIRRSVWEQTAPPENQVTWSPGLATFLRAQTAATPLSGVGTSRSALLLTVRVESGIARTKSNNGPRSWSGSVLLMLFWCCETHARMTSC